MYLKIVMHISIIGTGYVGLSLSALISQHHDVIAIDIDDNKIDMINNKLSPINDDDISYALKSKSLKLQASSDYSKCAGSNFIIIAVPTNYNPDTHYFDTTIVESSIKKIRKYCIDGTIVIKSTIPIGFTERISKELNDENIIFSPEFLREGKALYDNYHPSRIIVGYNQTNVKIVKKAQEFAHLLKECSLEDDVEILLTGSTEAECIKLFSNTYLALRVAYFNELDTFAENKGLNAEEIIRGVCLDPRIGDMYNNPSFGYGGYCLPKDTKQLLANYRDVPNNLIEAIVKSNDTRKTFISDTISSKLSNISDTIGVYKLAMKSGSDNFRESSILDVMRNLRGKGHKIIVYEPTISEGEFEGFTVINNLEDFKSQSSLIIANRLTSDLSDCISKVYCRDAFHRD